MSTTADRITRLLERNTNAGQRLHQAFTDWLDLLHASLTMLPRHLAAAQATGRLADDTPEIAALFARLREKYRHNNYWNNFSEATSLTLEHTTNFWRTDQPTPTGGYDLLGAIYMLTAANPHSGQFFTPWELAETMAKMLISDPQPEITDRLRQAFERARARNDAKTHLLTATVLAGAGLSGDQASDYFTWYVLPLIAADCNPITICDPCVGSGVMLLAAARQFPQWAVHAGLIQFYGMDIDATCVKMTQTNLLLHGVTCAPINSALTAPAAAIAALPEPFATAYTQAQTAQAAGDEATVTEIAETLRIQQALFDPTEFTMAAAPRQPAPTERPKKPRPIILTPSLFTD
jgi:hypothetical protein